MKYLYLLLIVFVGLTISGCNIKETSNSNPLPLDNQPTNEIKSQDNSKTMSDITLLPTADLLNISTGQVIDAVIKTNLGDIKFELFADKAPKTVANFVGLAEGTQPWIDPKTGEIKNNSPLYDGLIFHRVIKDFMIQGGDPMGSGMGGPGYKFEDEFVDDLNFDMPGTLAMANSGPNTNGSQFFITTGPTQWLNGKHTIFGKVIEGMDVLMKIQAVETGLNDKPSEAVTIKTIEIIRN